MGNLITRLEPYQSSSIPLKCTSLENYRSSTQIGAYIRHDITYSLSIANLYGFDGINVYINDELCDSHIIPSYGYGVKLDIRKAFINTFGIVHMRIKVRYGTAIKTYVSENMSILVRDTELNSSVENMVNYIYENFDEFLYVNYKKTSASEITSISEARDINTVFSMLTRIKYIYIANYNVLKINARTRLLPSTNVESFERLQNINSSTLQYIVSHPETLTESEFNTGIQFFGKNYIPKQTLVSKNIYSSDIYENRIIMSFLKSVILHIIKMYNELEKMLADIPTTRMNRDNLVDSSFCVYNALRMKYAAYKFKMKQLLEEYKNIYRAYTGIFKDVKVTELRQIPPPSPAFRNISTYGIVYNEIIHWFGFGEYMLEKEKALILSFMQTSKIYEYYVLLKINKAIASSGYIRNRSFAYNYSSEFNSGTLNNTFVYDKDNINIVIYYQPVIFGENNQLQTPNDIDLYRNTSITWGDNIHEGQCYTPDYIIKITKNNKSSYIILDAKFSDKETVRNKQVPILAFKYLTSISKKHPSDEIMGLCIIYGKSTDSDSGESIYNQSTNSDSITPFIDLLSVSGSNPQNYARLAVLMEKYINRALDKQ